MNSIARCFAFLALLPATLHAANPFDGIWRSQGYNFLLQIDGDSARFSDLTSEKALDLLER